MSLPLPPPSLSEAKPLSEGRILGLLAAVQFINVLDFMMVMPLGPDLAAGLSIAPSHIGSIAGSYTAAAAIAGLVGSLFLDRFDRRNALAVTMLGLVIGTVAGGFAFNLESLIAARILAGLFGGPATAIALSIIADVIPVERRGKAMGLVMGAFAIASVLGVPAGLELARLGGWRVPFFAVGGLGLVVASGAILLMPPLRLHLDALAISGPAPDAPLGEFLRRPEVWLGLAATGSALLAGFLLIPNIAAFLQYNLAYPREHMGRLYLIGGAISFAAMQGIGPLVDKLGASRVATIGTVLLAADFYFFFVRSPLVVPVMVVFVGFMVGSSFRSVAGQTLGSRVALPAERARYMSFQSATQHIASSIGSFVSAQMLSALPDGKLVGMARLGLVSLGVCLLLPPIMLAVEARLRKRDGLPAR